LESGKGVVAAPSYTAPSTTRFERGQQADVILKTDNVSELQGLWRSRLAPFGRRLSGEPTPSAPAALVEFDPSWASAAQRRVRGVRLALAGLPDAEAFAYEHIGSTAVPGLRAKPIIDLQIRCCVTIYGRTPPSRADRASGLSRSACATRNGL
jgi:hypothetical protein